MFSSNYCDGNKAPIDAKSNNSDVEISVDHGSNPTKANEHVSMTEGSEPAPSTQLSASAKSNDNSLISTNSDEIATLMAQANDNLERQLKEIKKAVKRIFKETVAFHEVSKSVHELWAPIQNSEHQESLRLDDLQAEVHGTIGAYAVPMDGFTNNNIDSTAQHLPST